MHAVLETAQLQLIIELAVAGKINGNYDAASSSARLQLLKAHQSAWRSLRWKKELKIPMKSGGLWELFGGVLGQSDEDNSLYFYRLPSELRNIEAKEWSLSAGDIDVHVRDFAMDPSLDLLVLVEAPDMLLADDKLEYRVHLRSLSTGKPHPRVSGGPVLRLEQKHRRDFTDSYAIQIWGDLVSIIFERRVVESELAVWEWTTNTLLNDIEAGGLLSSSFISDSWMLLGLMDHHGEIVLAAFPFRTTKLAEDQDPYKNAIKFRYPDLVVDAYITDIDIRCDPGSSSKNDAVPFSQDLTEFIIVVNLWLFAQDECYTHFIPSSLIMKLIEGPYPKGHESFPWSLWAPLNTRLLSPLEYPSDVWVCYVNGTKVVMSEPTIFGKHGYSLRVYDFNWRPMLRGAKSKGVEAPDGIDTSATVIDGGAAFECTVVTSLPFWSRAIDLEDVHDHCDVLCSEDQIIVVDAECREYRVLVF
ncbi:hypothetical protein D9613_002126 [Agrocybe pediades]|uniref:Uncharacterized protein n=1 Tax=Agrocybe pediades TaxID=84607 RepID=A0A8H4R7S7_9AGAR|nr:hypothetical protein D9613_002126 [Agrocybe pediades]